MTMNQLIKLCLTLYIVIGDIEAWEWTTWSSWSDCSRTCNGGASYQTRSCLIRGRCRGDSIRYKTCNLQLCNEQSDSFREQQCATYNDVLHNDSYYEWLAHFDPVDPCSLKCISRHHNIIQELAPKVLDGTKCYDAGDDMCIAGVCKRVGCDNVLGSTATLDRCGVCNGEGDSCHHLISGDSVFYWSLTDWSPCSVTCGKGYMIRRFDCFDRRNNNPVSHGFCGHLSVPTTETQECQMPNCKEPIWITGMWLKCSKSCEGGVSLRHIYCVVEQVDGTFDRTEDHNCLKNKPKYSKPCSNHKCPKWYAGQWSPCSVSCDSDGLQYREVICRKVPPHGCSSEDKPLTARTCYNNTACFHLKAETKFSYKKNPKIENDVIKVVKQDKENKITKKSQLGIIFEKQVSKTNVLKNSTSLAANSKEAKKLYLKGAPPTLYREDRPMEVLFESSKINESDAINLKPGQSTHQIKFAMKPIQYVETIKESVVDINSNTNRNKKDNVWLHDGILEPNAGSVIEQGDVKETPSFIKSEWSNCSTRCGSGVQTRTVICKVYLKFSRTIQELPDEECPGIKPSPTRQCLLLNCDEDVIDTKEVISREEVYIWKSVGYGECSVTCLGGVQSMLHACVRESDRLHMAKSYCRNMEKPDSQQRVCNIRACLPRWLITPFGECSASCGGGLRERRVECIQESLHDGLVVQSGLANSVCQDLMPKSAEICNIHDCKPLWKIGQWSECSTTCEDGVQHRQVYCEQKVHKKGFTIVPDDLCNQGKPNNTQMCSSDRCQNSSFEYDSLINADHGKVIQFHPISKLRLNVGVVADILKNTSVSVKCPTKYSEKTEIKWEHSNHFLTNRGRIQVSRKGSLIIKNASFSDSGVYTCLILGSVANITINVKTLSHGLQSYESRNISIDSVSSNATNLLLTKHSENRSSDDQWYGFIPSAWSTCSRPCGGIGIKSRTISCEKINFYHSKSQPDRKCKKIGLVKPSTTDKCGIEICPEWHTSEWAQCSADECLRNWIGVRRRSILCVLPNNTKISEEYCKQVEKPSEMMECRNDQCFATWTTSNWSKCVSHTCEPRGYQVRMLHCIWENNGKPAGSQCKGMTRPSVIQMCDNAICTKGCKDESSFCHVAKNLRLCRYSNYREHCCITCKSSNKSYSNRRSSRHQRRHIRQTQHQSSSSYRFSSSLFSRSSFRAAL